MGTGMNFLFMPETNINRHPIHIKRIVKDYKSILRNKEYMLPSISYCLLISIFFLWMFEAPFLMLETYGLSAMYYGISQALVFACFFVGAELTRYILNRHTLKKLLNVALLFTISGTIGFAMVTKFNGSMNAITVCLMVISIGASMLFAPLNRIAVESSTAPMGCRVAVYSTLISLFGAVSGWLVSMIHIHTLSSIAILIVLCVALAIIFLLKTKMPILLNDPN